MITIILEKIERVSTGLSILDEGMEGGYIKGSTNLLIGPAGSGKTIFGMTYLADGARNEENGLLIALQEPARLIKKHTARFSFIEEEFFLENKIILMDFSPSGWELLDPEGFQLSNDPMLSEMVEIDENNLAELNLASFLQRLLFEITECVQNYDVKRLVIDPLSALVYYNYNQSLYLLRKLAAAFIAKLSSLEVTSLLISEASGENRTSLFGEEFIVDSVIRFDTVIARNEMIRVFRIEKMRGTNHSMKLYRFKITPTGIEIIDI